MALFESVINTKCRLCHQNPGQHDITTNNDLTKSILSCTGIKVPDDDTTLMPKSVCDACKTTIETFHKFQQHVKNVNEFLQSKLIKNASEHVTITTKECAETNEFHGNKKTDRKKAEKCTICHNKIDNDSESTENNSDILCLFCDNRESPKFKSAKVMGTDSAVSCGGQTEHLEIESTQVVTSNIKSILTNSREDSTVIGAEQTSCLADEIIYTTPYCQICNEKFPTTDDLKIHTRCHKKLFACKRKNCDKVYVSAYTLKMHEMRHENNKSFLCVTCGKGFITKNSLTCHEKIHLTVKGYMCKICNIGFSVFVTKCSLERHEKIHQGIKEFQCEMCHSAFYTNKELMKHQKYHQGLKLNKCDVCFKTFFERHHLVIHLRKHSGEKPYTCPVSDCGKSFVDSQKLKRHQNARHLHAS